jgi:hypothetical protein
MISKESATGLWALINHFQSDLNGIKALDLNTLLHEILLSKTLPDHVDEATCKQWELKALQMTLTSLKNW